VSSADEDENEDEVETEEEMAIKEEPDLVVTTLTPLIYANSNYVYICSYVTLFCHHQLHPLLPLPSPRFHRFL
jgi:hypothetical protein